MGLNATNQPCGEGFYCLTGSDVAQPNGTHGEGGLCPEGYFCPEGKAQRILNILLLLRSQEYAIFCICFHVM